MIDKGSYLLLLRLASAKRITATKKEWQLEKGLYVYVGSAMGSLTGRIRRYLTDDVQKLFWHIDYLRDEAEVVMVFLLPSKRKIEETLSHFVSRFGVAIPGFGSSDCSTEGNLYRIYKEQSGELVQSLIEKWRGEYDWFSD